MNQPPQTSASRGPSRILVGYLATPSGTDALNLGIALARSWQAESAAVGPRVVIAQPTPMPTAVRARFFPGEDRGALTPCKDEAARILDAL